MTALIHRQKSGQTFALLLLLLVNCVSQMSCAPVLSKQFREQASPAVPFSDLLEDPHIYEGKKVIYGGYILDAINEHDGTLLTILQAPLDFQNRPHSRDKSKGRFLARTDKFMDPEIYKKDRRITVGGVIDGVRDQPLGKHTYTYPIIKIEEFYLWAEEKPQDLVYDPYWDYWGYPWYPYWAPIRPYPYHRRP